MRPTDDELRALLADANQRRNPIVPLPLHPATIIAIVGELLERRAADAKTKEEPEWMEM